MFVEGNNNVRGHDQVPGKYWGYPHWNYNINLKSTKNVPVLFHNLKGYVRNLIMQEIGKKVKIIIIPNGLENSMAFTINKTLVFTDSMQFKNYSLDALVKNLSDNYFKYESQEASYWKLKRQM